MEGYNLLFLGKVRRQRMRNPVIVNWLKIAEDSEQLGGNENGKKKRFGERKYQAAD